MPLCCVGTFLVFLFRCSLFLYSHFTYIVKQFFATITTFDLDKWLNRPSNQLQTLFFSKDGIDSGTLSIVFNCLHCGWVRIVGKILRVSEVLVIILRVLKVLRSLFSLIKWCLFWKSEHLISIVRVIQV